MIDTNGNWTRKYGIHSCAQFLADHVAQENALTDYPQDVGRQLQANGSFDFIGSSVDFRDRFTMTRAGLIAAAHPEGAPRTRRYLSRIADNGFTSHGLALTGEELAIETRLRTFSDVPYE